MIDCVIDSRSGVSNYLLFPLKLSLSV